MNSHPEYGDTFLPGPWRVIDETDVLALEGTPSSIVVASTKFFEGPSTSWERANARLIAAAPELLQTAQHVMDLYGNDFADGQDCDHDMGVCWCQGFLELRAAIAKAEGQS